MEPFAKGFEAMIGFDVIRKKRPVENAGEVSDIWPELGKDFELNQFYRRYSSAEGWLGEGYLAVWTQQEVSNLREPNLVAYPEKYHFFASDGGGTQFGFLVEDGEISFVSAPDIGGEDDIRIFGNWQDFLKAVELGDYI
ncbi:hypothetical protein [Roseibium salinum]|uniref:SMI1/KNR4 family protein n=1 Tax=Roseibium salinum TaxID=1604349 RepID=A0ABT3QZE5_9HYPH|nr:hypothetical protein [Roseibium sp. DSM 29163]MCX2722337.1 hypothetical protein [Roseibium sp. DSM 29163]